MSDPWLPGYDVGTRFCRDDDRDEREFPRLCRAIGNAPQAAKVGRAPRGAPDAELGPGRIKA